ncbi:hypothetical protein B2G69_07970 [Methylorubrum zatmanii]|nr:hypothetical protein B2G69_07970 [Methylorubrum zatmanii]
MASTSKSSSREWRMKFGPGGVAVHGDGNGERHGDGHHDDHHEVVREHHHHDDPHGGERRTTVIERH